MASLADLNVRLGADVSPLARGLNQAKGSISSFSGSVQTANAVLKRTNNTIIEVDSAIEGLEQAYVNARTAQARFAIGAKISQLRTLRADMTNATGAVNAMGGGFSSTGMAVVNFNRVVQDAPFGILGVANNIEPLLLSFQSLKKEAGSTGMALKQLIKGAFTGPGALITVFSVVSSLAIVFSRRSRDNGKAGEEASEGISKQAEALREVAQAYESLNQKTTEQAIDNEIAFTQEILDNVKALNEAERIRDKYNTSVSGSLPIIIKLTDAQRQEKEEALRSIPALKELIKLYGEDALTVEELEEKIVNLNNAKNGLNNSTRTEVQLGKVIQDQQAKTAQATNNLTAGLEGAEKEAGFQAITLSTLIAKYRILANENQDFVPVVIALQKELDGLSKEYEKVTGNVLDAEKGIAQISETAKEDPGLGIDFTELDAELAGVNDEMDAFFASVEALRDPFAPMAGSVTDLNAKMMQLKYIQSLISDPEQFQQLQIAIDAIKNEIGLLTGETVGLSNGLQFVDALATTFVNNFGQGMTNIVMQGEKLQDVLKNIGKLLLSSAIQLGVSLLLTGGVGGGVSGGLFGAIFPKLKTPSLSGGALATAGAVAGSINTNNVSISGEFRVKGTDLVLSLERANQVINR